jgi:WD40 repeat protein
MKTQTGNWSAPLSYPQLRKAVISLAFNQTGTMLAAGFGVVPVPGREHPIALWNVDTGELMEPAFIGHRFEVMSLSFSPDSTQLASGSWDQDVRLWDVKSRKLLPPVLVEAALEDAGGDGESLGPTVVSISPDGQTLASLRGGTVALWEISNHKSIAQFPGLIRATALAFSEKGDVLAVGGKSGNVMLVPMDFTYWMKRACIIRGGQLSEDEKRYYLGEVDEPGPVVSLLWKAYSGIGSLLGQRKPRIRVAADPCSGE